MSYYVFSLSIKRRKCYLFAVYVDVSHLAVLVAEPSGGEGGHHSVRCGFYSPGGAIVGGRRQFRPFLYDTTIEGSR